jgi:hypothetical protein
MVETIVPDVYIDVRPEGLIVPARIGVGRVGVVGTASRGPLGTAVTLADYSAARAMFGGYDAWQGRTDQLTLSRALELVFANGATTVLAVRVAGKKSNGSTSAVAAKKDLASATGTAVTLKAATPGTWGNALQVQVEAATESPYILDELHKGNEPTVTLQRKPVLESARNRVRWFDSTTGVTTSLEVVYDSAPAPTANQVKIAKATGVLSFGPAIHADDTITASYVVAPASGVLVTVAFAGPAGVQKESYTVVDGKDLVAKVKAVADAGGSPLVTAADGTKPGEPPTKTTGFAAFDPGQDGVTDADYTGGLETLLGVEANIVVAAGQDESFADELASHCAIASTDARKRERIAVVGAGAGRTVDAILGHPVNSDRVIYVAPGIRVTDRAAQPVADVDLPGAFAAAAVAGLIASLDAHVSPTNKQLLAVGGLTQQFTPPEIAQLIQARVLVLESRTGTRVVKGITTSTNTAWAQITTRRIVDYAKAGVRSAAVSYIGLLNNSRVRAAMRTTINSFLTGMVDAEMLQKYTLDVTATRSEEIQGIARVTIVLNPVFSIDYIQVTMFLQ